MIKFKLALAIATASIGSGFQHGYNTGVLNAPQEVISDWIKNSKNSGVSTAKGVTIMWSIIVAIYCVGGMIGGLMTGLVANKVGRKMGLLVNNIIAIVASILFCIAKPVECPPLLIVGRTIIGVNNGLNAGLCPMYLSEISINKRRGATGSCYQLWLTVSILFAQIIGFKGILGNEENWPLLFTFIAIVGVLQMLALTACPESPKYYMDVKNNEEKASDALVKLYDEDEKQVAFSEMKADVAAAKAEPVTVRDLFKQKKLRTPLLLLCALMATQQLSGINAVIFYSTSMFEKANLDHSKAQIATIGMGAVNVLMTICSVWLIEKAGRKPLLIFGLIGMMACTTILVICLYTVGGHVGGYIAIAMIYGFIISFAIGLGPIPWLIGAELFTTGARGAAISVAVAVNWFFNFIVAVGFLPLQQGIAHAVFFIFIACQAVSCAYIWIFVPETKNKPIEEISKLFE